jgi:hypothetical protein
MSEASYFFFAMYECKRVLKQRVELRWDWRAR